MKFIHIECLVPSSSMRDAMRFFDEHKIWAKPIADSQVAGQKKESNGRAPRGTQNEWITKHVNEEMPLGDIKAMWIKDGFDAGAIYAALKRAVDKKVIKRLASGNYKPTGAA